MISKVIITISGPTASGKSTLESMFIEKYGYGKIKGTTTRPPRAEDADGSKYNFTTNEEFKKMINDGEVIEYIGFIDPNGGEDTLYGTTQAAVEVAFEDHDTVVAVLDPTGVDALKKTYAGSDVAVYSVFLNTTPEIRVERIAERYANELKRIILDQSRTKDALSIFLTEIERRFNAIGEIEISWQYQHTWDVVYHTFDESTQNFILDQINFIQGTLFTNN